MKKMENVKLSDWFKEMLDCELNNDLLEGNEVEEYNNFVIEFFKFEGKDREIELNDLRNDDGILYKKMVDWNENELVKKLELNMVWYEYSLEDYFRDMFDLNNEDSVFKLFSLREINSVLYKDYNDDDWVYND
jgi:hypothetical protein